MCAGVFGCVRSSVCVSVCERVRVCVHLPYHNMLTNGEKPFRRTVPGEIGGDRRKDRERESMCVYVCV